jgi:hypothetical protein
MTVVQFSVTLLIDLGEFPGRFAPTFVTRRSGTAVELRHRSMRAGCNLTGCTGMSLWRIGPWTCGGPVDCGHHLAEELVARLASFFASAGAYRRTLS